MKITAEIKGELERIRLADEDQLLRPEAVVAASRAKASPLHGLFMWDDTAGAAHLGRLDIARQLIVKVKVTIITPEQREVKVRVYQSLPSDRATSGGYRHLDTVMNDQGMRGELIRSAIRDLDLFQNRYRHLKELTSFWDSIATASSELKTMSEAEATV